MPAEFIDVIECLNGVELKPFQKEIIEAVGVFNRVCVVASRQIGKSFALMHLAIAWAECYDDQLILIASPGERQASELLKKIRRVLKDQKYSPDLAKDSSTEIQLAKTRSRILSLPNSPRTIRGYSCNLLLVDEVDGIENWDDFESALFPSVAAPTVNGSICCSGTYKGKRQLWDMTKDSKWYCCGPYPWTVNPPIDIEQFKHDLPTARFEEEFNCNPVDASSTLFPFEMIDACMDKTGHLSIEPQKPANGAIYFAGYDPAKTADPSILIMLELLQGDDRPRMRLTRDYNGQLYSEQAACIKALHDIFHFHSIGIDCTGTGGGPFEMVQGHLGSRAQGINFNRTVKETLINDLRIAIQDKLIILQDDQILRKELHDLLPATLDHPSGGSSDRVWALALANHMYKQTQRTVKPEIIDIAIDKNTEDEDPSDYRMGVGGMARR